MSACTIRPGSMKWFIPDTCVTGSCRHTDTHEPRSVPIISSSADTWYSPGWMILTFFPNRSTRGIYISYHLPIYGVPEKAEPVRQARQRLGVSHDQVPVILKKCMEFIKQPIP